MSGKYWDVPWNPVRGCCPVSAGCAHCWAAAQASRFAVPAWKGLAEGGKWTGESRFDTETLAKPLRWRRPRVVATCWMGDLFYGSVSDEQIAAVFGVMAACPQHTFLVLTKRAERMRAWFAEYARVNATHPAVDTASTGGAVWLLSETTHAFATPDAEWAQRFDALADRAEAHAWEWPLPNVRLGVSVEDQATADERIPHLLACPATVRWVSYEPALAGVDFTGLGLGGNIPERLPVAAQAALWGARGLDWIVVGGESGPDARPCDVEWIRDVVQQCKAAEVPCYVKQLGARAYSLGGDALCADGRPPVGVYLGLRNRAGADPSEWPADLRVRELPEVPRA